MYILCSFIRNDKTTSHTKEYVVYTQIPYLSHSAHRSLTKKRKVELLMRLSFMVLICHNENFMLPNDNHTDDYRL